MVEDTLMDGIANALLQHLAVVLSYPGPDLLDSAKRAEALVPAQASDVATLLREFRRFVEGTSTEGLEEAYIRAFELQATHPPYVGFHLFGESYKRSVFLVELRKSCRRYGVITGSELPDHIALIVKLLSVCTDTTFARDLIDEALLPALSRMVGEGPEERQTAVEHQFRSEDARSNQSSDAAPYLLAIIATKRLFEGRPYGDLAPAAP